MQAAATADRAPLRSLEAVVADLALPAAVERMAAVVGEAAVRALAANLVVVALLDQDGRRLRPMHTVGLPPRALRAVMTAGADEAALPGAGLNGSSMRRKGDAFVAQRIAVGARNLGMVVLGRPSKRPFSTHDRAFLNVLAGLFALALDRRRLADPRGEPHGALPRPTPCVGRAAPQIPAATLVIDLRRQEVTIDGRVVRLTPSELRLLLFLAEEPGRPRSRREILRHLSGIDGVGHERACDVHISNLRRKIEKCPSRPKRLVTLRGVGYALKG